MANVTKDASVKANITVANYRIPEKVKNLSIGFEGQGGDLYVNDPSGFTTFSGSYVTSSGIRFFLSGTGTASGTLAAAGAALDADEITLIATLQNDDNKRLFGTAHATFYQDSASLGNDIPYGDNVDMENYDFSHNLDWGQSDNRNIVSLSYLRNLSASPVDYEYRVNFRYIAEDGSF